MLKRRPGYKEEIAPKHTAGALGIKENRGILSRQFAKLAEVLAVPPDAWEFQENSLSLVNGTKAARLTRKAGDTLACLLRHKGRVVSHDEILRAVWPNLHVTPDLVREYVSDLRSLLGDDAREPHFIETVRGRGYRLIGDIRCASTSASAALLRIAVIGVADPSLDERWSRLARALAEEIGSELARYPDLAVVGHELTQGACHDLRALGEIVDAKYIVRGSIAVYDDDLRALFELVECSTARISWTRRFRHPANAFPRLVEEVAAGVASSLGGLLGQVTRLERDLVRRKLPETLDAYEHYLIGLDADDHHDADSLLRAFHHLDLALAQEPAFAYAWFMRENVCYQIIIGRLLPDLDVWETRRRQSIEKAFESDPRDPLVLGRFAIERARNGAEFEALALIERAIDLAENNAHASAFLSLPVVTVAGDATRALELIDRALVLDPRPPSWQAVFEMRASFFCGDSRRTLAVAARATDFLSTLVYRCLAAAQLNDAELAARYWNDLLTKHPTFDVEAYAREAAILNPTIVAQYRAGMARLATMVA